MIPVDAVDARGRRYLKVDTFPDGLLKEAFRDLQHRDACVECGAFIRHAFDRYFQRNDPGDGVTADIAGALLGLTYDAVCGACGDRILKDDSK